MSGISTNGDAIFETPEEIETFLALPLLPGMTRIFSCTECGALTYIRFFGNDTGVGDPMKHAVKCKGNKL